MRKVSRLTPKPPDPIIQDPHAQLDWLAKQFTRRYANEVTKRTFFAQIDAYKKFLREAQGYDMRLTSDPRFYISVHFDVLTLYNANKYWRSEGFAGNTINSRLKALRSLFNYAMAKGYTPCKSFIDPITSESQRESETREAYDEKDLTFIRRMIEVPTKHAMRVVQGYNPTGIGRDPRVGKGGITRHNYGPGSNRTLSDIEGVGWSQWSNIVWYFEHVLQGRAIRGDKEHYNEHLSFFMKAAKYHAGIDAVWRKLGVTPLVDTSLVAPLTMKLAYETGLNPDVIFNLKRDCYQESHPLTGQPYLRYYKERSTGEKELHPELLDLQDEKEFQFLPKQSVIIKRTIGLLREMTEPLVSEANDQDKGLLLLVQQSSNSARSQNHTGSVRRLTRYDVRNWASSQIREAKKNGETDVPDYLNLARFRPTKITKLVREGHDFFLIQAVAGHKNYATTSKYLNRHQLNETFQREVSTTLVQIHRNRDEFEQNPRPYANAASTHQEGVVYKGVMCDCKNVFAPPDTVKKLPTYKEGQPCTYWNMCLFCPNVLITKKHLPLLIAYERDIESAVSGSNLSHVPNAQFYLKALAVLEGVFLEFDEEAIERAKEMSEGADVLIDPVIYKGVIDEPKTSARQEAA